MGLVLIVSGAAHQAVEIVIRDTLRYEKRNCSYSSPEACYGQGGRTKDAAGSIYYGDSLHWEAFRDRVTVTEYRKQNVQLTVIPKNAQGKTLSDATVTARQSHPRDVNHLNSSGTGQSTFTACSSCEPVQLTFGPAKAQVVIDVRNPVGCVSQKSVHLFRDGVHVASSEILQGADQVTFQVTEPSLYTATVSDGILTENLNGIRAGNRPDPATRSVPAPSHDQTIEHTYAGHGDYAGSIAFPTMSLAPLDNQASALLDHLASLGYEVGGLRAQLGRSPHSSQRILAAASYFTQLEDMQYALRQETQWAALQGVAAAGSSPVFTALSLTMKLWNVASLDRDSRARWQGAIAALKRRDIFFSAAFHSQNTYPQHQRPSVQLSSSPMLPKSRRQQSLDEFAAALRQAPPASDYCQAQDCLTRSLRGVSYSVDSVADFYRDAYNPALVSIVKDSASLAKTALDEAKVTTRWLERLPKLGAAYKAASELARYLTLFRAGSRMLGAMGDAADLVNFKPDLGVFINPNCSVAGRALFAYEPPMRIDPELSTPARGLHGPPTADPYPGLLTALRSAVQRHDRPAITALATQLDAEEALHGREILATGSRVSAAYRSGMNSIPGFEADYAAVYAQPIADLFLTQARLDMLLAIFLLDPSEEHRGDLLVLMDELIARYQRATVSLDTFAALTAALPRQTIYQVEDVQVERAADPDWDYEIRARVTHAAGPPAGQLVVNLISEDDVLVEQANAFDGEPDDGIRLDLRWRVKLPVLEEDTEISTVVEVMPDQGYAASWGLYLHGYPTVREQRLGGGWQMMSVPCEPYDRNAGASLATAVGGPLQLYHYAGGGYQAWSAADPSSVPLTAGHGYWLWLPAGATLEVRGRAASLAEVAVVPLQTGWNQIGSPFGFPVAWGTARVRFAEGDATRELGIAEAHAAGIARNYIYWYEAGGQKMATAPNGVLKPWFGYWVRAERDCELLLEPTQAEED